MSHQHEREPAFTVWAKVAGPYLPEDEVSIGPWQVGRRSPRGKSLMIMPIELGASYAEQDDGIVGAGMSRGQMTHAHVDVTSPCVAYIEVHAPNAGDAGIKAREEYAPFLLASLAALGQGGYWLEVFLVEDQSGNLTRVANEGSVAVWHEAPVPPPEHVRFASEALRLCKEHSAARVAAWALIEGQRRARAAQDASARAHSLLAYFKVVEGLAQDLSKSRDKQDAETKDESRRRILVTLTAELKRGPVGQQVSAVHRAAQAFKTADASTLASRIEFASETLGLDATWRTQALDFLQFRNNKLGHSSGSVSLTECHSVPAAHIAETMWAAYVSWKLRSQLSPLRNVPAHEYEARHVYQVDHQALEST